MNHISYNDFELFSQSSQSSRLDWLLNRLGNTQYRCVEFPVQDFLKHTKRSKNYYQLDKLVRFFDKLMSSEKHLEFDLRPLNNSIRVFIYLYLGFFYVL